MKLLLNLIFLSYLKLSIQKNLLNNTLFKSEELLFKNLLNEYNKSIKPPGQSSVLLTFELYQIISLIEKDQIITLNTWISQAWIDERLSWNPGDYQNISLIYVPSDRIWM